MGATIKIRIPIAVDPRGRWLAYGWLGIADHDEMLDAFDSDTIGPYEALFWVEVELPVPQIESVPGTATPLPVPPERS